MTYRIRNIVVAVGLALVAALLTTFYVANYKRHVQQSESTVTVYVAKHDITAGTPGSELIKSGAIQTAQAAKHSVVPGAISNPDQVRSLITREDIFAGEQVSLRRFASNAEQGVRAQLHGTLRAISIPGTPDALLAGTLRDGDHVDLVANLKIGNSLAVRNIARDVLVLRASTSTGSVSATKPNQGTSVLLAVHDNREEQKIWFAVENSAGWTLALRPVANATDSPEDVEGSASVLRDGVTSANAAHYAGSGR